MRRHNFQTIAWFRDLYLRKLLNLDPPYQRRSVWNQSYKDYFIDTILLGYPAPAVFLYEEINDSGVANYNVVDGKQRLITIFEFVDLRFPISEDATLTEFRGKYFDELPAAIKNLFWGYTFLVEYLPTIDESIINTVFDRINRNVAKLTSQELRHAKYSGCFISTAEELTEWIFKEFNQEFPRIAPQSRKQMKDVELISQLLLIIEDGIPKGYSKDELDEAFSNRDSEWERQDEIKTTFKEIISKIKNTIELDTENIIIKSRFKNQADFYSLFSSFHSLLIQNQLPNPETIKTNLLRFINIIENEEQRKPIEQIDLYYFHTQSGVNRNLARQERSEILAKVIKGEIIN